MNSNIQIISPSVYLFAFHFNLKNDDSNLQEDNLLWQKCNEIFSKLNIKQELQVHNEKSDYGGKIHLLKTNNETEIFLPFNGELTQDNYKLEGLAYPFWFEDSSGLVLSVGIESQNKPETNLVSIEYFKYLNPDRCFFNIKSQLRQVIILTAKLTNKQIQEENPTLFKTIADESVKSFCQKPLAECPPFYQNSQLLGSPIFEYGDPKNPHEDSYSKTQAYEV